LLILANPPGGRHAVDHVAKPTAVERSASVRHFKPIGNFLPLY